MGLRELEVVDVHLVGQPWWVSAAPYAALLLSLASIVLTLVLQYRNDARIKATASVGLTIGQSSGGWKLKLSATNIGRTGQTHVNALMLRLSDGRGLAKVLPEPMDTALPCPLGPGEEAHIFIDVEQELLSHVSDVQIDGLRVEVATGHRTFQTPIEDHVKKQLKSIRVNASGGMG